jgi:hypothetical protein
MILRLPRVRGIIIKYLDGDGIKALRATCRGMNGLVGHYSPSIMRFAFYNHMKPHEQRTLPFAELKCYCYFNKVHYNRSVSFKEMDFEHGNPNLFPWLSTTTEIHIDGSCLENADFIDVFYKVLMLIEYWKITGFDIKILHPVDASNPGLRQLVQRINVSTSWFKVHVHVYQSDSDPLVLSSKFANVIYEPHYDADKGTPPFWRFWFGQGDSTFSDLSSVTISGNKFREEIDLQSVPFFFQSSSVNLRKLIFVHLNFVVNSATGNWKTSNVKELHFINCTVSPKTKLLPTCNPCFVSEKLIITGQESNVLEVFDFPQLTDLIIGNDKLPPNPLPTDFSLPNLKYLYCPINPTDPISFVESLFKLRKLETLVLYYCRASEKSIQRLTDEVIFSTPTLRILSLVGDQTTKTYLYPTWQEEREPNDNDLITGNPS